MTVHIYPIKKTTHICELFHRHTVFNVYIRIIKTYKRRQET